MIDDVNKIAEDSQLDLLYMNNLFSVKSICQQLGTWDNYSTSEKRILETLTKKDTELNKIFDLVKEEEEQIKIRWNNTRYLRYGEVTKKGYDRLIELIKKHKKNISTNDVFVNIGSGCGKSTIHTSIRLPIKTCVGVEIQKERYEYSKSILEKFQISDRKVFFINKDILDFDLSIATIVYCNNLYFPDELLDAIYEKLPTGCHFISTRYYQKFKILKDIVRVENTWSKKTFAFFYYIK